MKTSHGGNIISMAARLGCPVAELLDMSSNLTPLGMVPGLREELISHLPEISYLPEAGSETLVELFRNKYKLKKGEALAGNGTTEFIFALPAALGKHKALLVNPTYSDYQVACFRAGVKTENFLLQRQEDFQLDFARLAASLSGGELVFICNPNNPTSVLIPSPRLADFIKRHPATSFVVDESYLPFTREKSLLDLGLPDNLFLLCSQSKIYGIPGLRLGFMVAKKENLVGFSSRGKPWGVNRLAQVAGEFLLAGADDYVRRVQDFIAKERPRVTGELEGLPGVSVIPGAANFILAYLSGAIKADRLRERMLARKIMIRDCANFTGLDHNYFRISLKDSKANQRCLAALEGILSPA